MSDILCRWLNSELRLSKSVEPNTFAKDFSSGYLIGEVLHKYQLQDDFSIFIKSKLNNFTRIEPTLKLLGVPFDLTTAEALMQEQHDGAATRLLYQLYILLQKKKTAGLTGTAMETMQPAATACLHRKEKDIYSDRQWQWRDKSVTAQQAQQQKQLRDQEERRMKDIEKLRAARRRQNEIMASIQASTVQVPKPPPRRSDLQNRQQHQQLRRKQQAQKVQAEIAEFQRNRKKLGFGSSSSQSVPGDVPLASSSQGHKVPTQKVPRGEAEAALQFNSEYIQRIRQGLEEDALERQEREKRRRKFLIDQLKAHEAQEEVLREEQLVQRLTRQTQQERRLAAQLLQIRRQKEVIRQNRLVRERQYQERRERDFQEALEREAALAGQEKLHRAEEIRKEKELFNKMAAERAQNRHRKHSEICRAVVDQIVDLATKAGQYRLLTGNLIPGKLMREWKELLFSGVPLYEPEDQQQDPVELERLEILNNQDYDEYTDIDRVLQAHKTVGETKATQPHD